MRFLSLLGLQLLVKIAASQTSYFINPPDSSASSNGLTIQEGTVYTVTWQTNLPFVALTLWAEGDNNFEYPSGSSNMTNTGSYNWRVATSKSLTNTFYFGIYLPGDTSSTLSSTFFKIIAGSAGLPPTTVLVSQSQSAQQPTTVVAPTTILITPTQSTTQNAPTSSAAPPTSTGPTTLSTVSTLPSKGSGQSTSTQTGVAVGVSTSSSTGTASTPSSALGGLSTVTINAPQTTASPNAPNSPPTSSTGLSPGTKLGIGIGFGVGVPLALAIGALVGWKVWGQRKQTVEADELQMAHSQPPIFGGVGGAGPVQQKYFPVPTGGQQSYEYYGNPTVAHEVEASYPLPHELESPRPSRGGSTNNISELPSTRHSVRR